MILLGKNDLLRTLLCTDTTAYALLLIDICHIVNDMYGIMLTVLLTKMTSDTSNRTCLHDIFTLVLRTTLY